MKTIRNVGWGPNLLTSVLYADRTYNFAPGVDVEVSDDVADYVHHMYGAHGLQIVVEPRSRLFFSDGVTPLLTECTDFLDFDALRKVRAAVGPPTHVIRGVKEIPGGPLQLDVEPITYKVEFAVEPPQEPLSGPVAAGSEDGLGVFDPSLEAAVAAATSPDLEPEVVADGEETTPPSLEDDVAKSIGISSEQLAGLEHPDPHKPHHKAKRK